MDGRTHFAGGIVSCLVTSIVIMLYQWNFSVISLLFAGIFGGLFALYPDLDLKLHVGHRNAWLHSAFIPGIILFLIICILITSPNECNIATRNFMISFGIYFASAFGSHLVLDCPQGDVVGMKKWGKLFLFVNGIVLFVAGILTGIFLLI